MENVAEVLNAVDEGGVITGGVLVFVLVETAHPAPVSAMRLIAIKNLFICIQLKLKSDLLRGSDVCLGGSLDFSRDFYFRNS